MSENNGNSIMLGNRHWRRFEIFGACVGTTRDPSPDDVNLRNFEAILLAGRHLTALDLFVKRTLLRIARDDDWARLSPFAEAARRARIEFGFTCFPTAATYAFKV